MLNKIKTYIAQNRLLASDAAVIVGLSGGMDSMALLDALTLLEYRCIAAHCNFHLRGEESDDDARFVKKWCKMNDVEFTAIDFDTRQYARDKKISIEMAARDLRYNWFEIVRKQYDAQAIAVAHHKDDSVETVLLNLVRGTGIGGLCGISVRNGYVVRPMLCVTRSEIEKYIGERGISYRTDSSNGEDVYFRNFIRLNIIPMLQKLNPSVGESISRTSQNLDEVRKVYKELVDKDVDKVFKENKIDIARLKQTISPVSVLYEILFPLGFHPSVIEDVERGINSISGKTYFSPDYRLIRDRRFFILDKKENPDKDENIFRIDENVSEINTPIRLRMTVSQKTDIDKRKHVLTIDAGKVRFPLILRKWRFGDWFVPFGMRGKKKLSDFFTDQKLSLQEKEDVWVLFSEEKVVWIVGHRADDRFKVTATTKKKLVLELLEE